MFIFSFLPMHVVNMIAYVQYKYKFQVWPTNTIEFPLDSLHYECKPGNYPTWPLHSDLFAHLLSLITDCLVVYVLTPWSLIQVTGCSHGKVIKIKMKLWIAQRAGGMHACLYIHVVMGEIHKNLEASCQNTKNAFNNILSWCRVKVKQFLFTFGPI